MTAVVGEDLARDFLYSHEMVERISNHTLMDVHNNSVGINHVHVFGAANATRIYFARASEFKELIRPLVAQLRVKLERGELKVLRSASAESRCRHQVYPNF